MTKCQHCDAEVLSTPNRMGTTPAQEELYMRFDGEEPSDDDWKRAVDCALSCLTKVSITRAELDNAMQHAFGILALAAASGEASWRSGATPADEEARDNLRLIDYIADKIGLPDTDELSRENFDAWMSATPAVGGEAFVIPVEFGRKIEAAWDIEPTPFNRADVAVRIINATLAAAQPASPLRGRITDEMLNAHIKAVGDWAEPFTAERESGVAIDSDISQEDADQFNADERARLRKGYEAAFSASSPEQPAADPVTGRDVLKHCDELHDLGFNAGWNGAIEQCALVAEGFDAACDSPRMKLFVDAGLILAIYKRDGEIGAAIRALTAPNKETQA